jgi:hypothetical protein
MNMVVSLICALVLVTCCVPRIANGQPASCEPGPGIVTGQTHGWPLQPTDEDHPLGATLGEFQDLADAKVYQHTGIDILATPPCSPGDAACIASLAGSCGSATEACVILTVGGTVDFLPPPKSVDLGPGEGDELYIKSTHCDAPDIIAVNAERTYRYLHLEHQSYFATFVDSYFRDDRVQSGTPVARVNPWTCDYQHLHYDVTDDTAPGGPRYLNPLRDIDFDSRPDGQAPEISKIKLAKHNGSRWTAINNFRRACIVVMGKVDIIAKLRDRDDAGSDLPGATNVGVYDLHWRACPESTPDCPWNDTHSFEDMPVGWESPDNPDTKAQFSTTPQWVSDFSECSTSVNQTFMVPTSSSSTASWDTTDGTYPDGSYLVSVEASDIAGNISVKTIHACVANRQH